MNCKYFVVDNGSDRKVVEDIREHLPHPRITILLLALGVKAIYLRDLSGLVISSD